MLIFLYNLSLCFPLLNLWSLGVFNDLNAIFICCVLFCCRFSICCASGLMIRILCSFVLSSYMLFDTCGMDM